jgi:hypothetical protein
MEWWQYSKPACVRLRLSPLGSRPQPGEKTLGGRLQGRAFKEERTPCWTASLAAAQSQEGLR